MLREGELSQASRDQEALLGDLGALLELLTSNESELDKRRAERQRLEQMKRAIRTLMDEQAERLSRTQSAPKDDPEGMRRLEDAQRDTQRKTQELQREMESKSGSEQQTPGAENARKAAEHMQRAADKLGEAQPENAQPEQEQALKQLQQALDELEDALRQVRREEMEQTLAALEARFKAMLEHEQEVRAAVAELQTRGRSAWARMDQLRLTEAIETQRQVERECEVVERILTDEGTTVILPELVNQLADDVGGIARRLEQSDTSAASQRLLDDVIELLEEIIGAIETRREQQEQPPEQNRPQQASQESQSLLPGSAELKLLKGSQLRINERTINLAESLAAAPEEQARREIERLSVRQRRLAELTLRMHERK
jgi:hypothetical protein